MIRLGSAAIAASSAVKATLVGAPVGCSLSGPAAYSRTENEGDCTALPSPHQASAKELHVDSILLGLLLFEIIKFRPQLEKITESEKAPIQGPGRASGRVAIASEKHDALTYGFLPFEGFGVNVFHGRLRDSVEVAKARMMLAAPKMCGESRERTVHAPFLCHYVFGVSIHFRSRGYR